MTALVLIVAWASLAGCTSSRLNVPVAATPMAVAGIDDPHARMEFWAGLGRQPVVRNDDAFRALLLYVDGADPSADYPARAATLKARGLIPSRFDAPADAAADRGTLAFAFTRALGIKGGMTMRVLGPSPRYAVRAMEYRGLYPASSPNQAFTGPELVGVFGRVEDWQRGNPADAPAALLPGEVGRPGETVGLVGSTVVSPTPEAGNAPPDDPADLSATHPLLLNVLDTMSFNAWWLPPPPDTRPAGPASQPVPTKDKPVKLKAIITGVEGELAEVRKSEADAWVRAKVGMSVGEAAEFRTGPKSAIRFVIPPDHVYTVDRQGSVKLLQAVYDGQKLTTDVGMQQGRVRLDVAKIAVPATTQPGTTQPVTPAGKPDEPAYKIYEAGIEHDSTIRSPNTALAIRGTVVSLLDEPPFAPEAVSLTGRAAFRNTRRQVVAFGGVGAGKTVVRGDQTTAAQQAYARSTRLPNPLVAANDFAAQETALVLDRGGLVRGDVLVGNSRLTEAQLTGSAGGKPFLPGFLNFVLQWEPTPRTQLNDLNLQVFSPVSRNFRNPDKPYDFVANPPFVLSLDPKDPNVSRLRDNSALIPLGDPNNPPSAAFYPKTSATGGQIGKNHVGPQGLEVAFWPRSYPTGDRQTDRTYQVFVYNLIAAKDPPAETIDPVNFTLTTFLGRDNPASPAERYTKVGQTTGSLGHLQTIEIDVRLPADPNNPNTGAGTTAGASVVVKPAAAVRSGAAVKAETPTARQSAALAAAAARVPLGPAPMPAKR